MQRIVISYAIFFRLLFVYSRRRLHSDVIKTHLTDRPRDSSAAAIATIMRLYSLPVLVVVFAKRIKRIATFVCGDVRSDAVEVCRFIAAVVVVVRVHFSGDDRKRK